jgi:hypothetical protein
MTSGELYRSPESATSFIGVRKNGASGFSANHAGKYLGHFKTPEGAAAAYSCARKGSCGDAKAQEAADGLFLSHKNDEVAEAKHSSCLRLRTSERNATGFLSVYPDGQRFVAKAGSNRLGTCSTALEAAERVAWSLVGRSQLMRGGMRRVAAVCKRKILELNAALRAKRMPPPCGQQPTYAWQSRHAVDASRSVP